MSIKEQREEIKEQRKTWTRRLVIWCFPLLVGLFCYVFKTETMSGKFIIALFVSYIVFIISMPIRALYHLYKWSKELDDFEKSLCKKL